jgi:hypothetical protein
LRSMMAICCWAPSHTTMKRSLSRLQLPNFTFSAAMPRGAAVSYNMSISGAVIDK